MPVRWDNRFAYRLTTTPLVTDADGGKAAAEVIRRADESNTSGKTLDDLLSNFQTRALEIFNKFRDIGNIPIPGGAGRVVKVLGYAVAGGKALVAVFRRGDDPNWSEVFQIDTSGLAGEDVNAARSLWDRWVTKLAGERYAVGDVIVVPVWVRDP